MEKVASPSGSMVNFESLVQKIQENIPNQSYS